MTKRVFSAFISFLLIFTLVSGSVYMPAGAASTSQMREDINDLEEKSQKLEKEIAKLEKLARAEKQPKKKFELVSSVKRLKNQLSSLS